MATGGEGQGIDFGLGIEDFGLRIQKNSRQEAAGSTQQEDRERVRGQKTEDLPSVVCGP